MGDRHPNQDVVDGISRQLADAHSIVRRLHTNGNAHLNQIKRILVDGKGSFPRVMADMKEHAVSVVKESTAAETVLQKAMDDTNTWCLHTSPLSSAPSNLTRAGDAETAVPKDEDMATTRVFNMKDKFRIGM